MTEGHSSPNHHLVNSFGSNLAELLSIVTAFAIAVSAVGSYIRAKITIRETLAVQFQALGFLAFATGTRRLMSLLDGH